MVIKIQATWKGLETSFILNLGEFQYESILSRKYTTIQK